MRQHQIWGNLGVNKLTTQQVILYLGITAILMGGATLLVMQDKDVGIILSIMAIVVVPILTAAGASVAQSVNTKLENIKEVQNGNLSQILNMLREQQQGSQTLTHMAVQKLENQSQQNAPANGGNGGSSS